MSRKLKFIGSCVSLPRKKVMEAVDRQRLTSRETFCRYVCRESLKEVESSLGYVTDPKEPGMRMVDEPYVDYWSSKYNGKPCRGFTQSSIDYIFH